jgi:hypothetical protein
MKCHETEWHEPNVAVGLIVVVNGLLSAIQWAGISSLQCTPSRLCTSSTVPPSSWGIIPRIITVP